MLSSCSFSWRTGAEQGSNSAGTLGKLLQPLPGCPAQHRHGRQAAETGKGSALGAERKRRPQPDKADSTFPAWQRAGKRGGSRKHLSLELPAEVAKAPGRCHSLSTGASRGQRRRAGVSKGQQWGKKRTITSTPSCPDPFLLPGRAQIFPWDPWGQGTPLSHSSHPFPKLRSPTRCSSRIREQELSQPAGGPRPLEGPPIPLSSFTGAPGLGHTPIPQNPPKKTPRGRPQPRTEALHRRRGGTHQLPQRPFVHTQQIFLGHPG